MVQLYLLRTALLRSKLPKVPISLLSQQLRYKSLTASIARGKESDNFAGPRRDDRRGARPDRSDSRPPYNKSRSSDLRSKRDFEDRESRPSGAKKPFDHKGRPSNFGQRGGRPRRDYGDNSSREFGGSEDRLTRPRRGFGDDRGPRPSFGSDRESQSSRDSKGPRESRPRYGGSKDSRPPGKSFGGLGLYPTSEYHQLPESLKHRPTSRDSRSPREYNERRDKEWDPSASGPRAERSGFKFSDTHIEDISRTDYSLASLPYTTAASEFLYGHSSVLAAIKTNRRKLYTLYIHTRGLNHEGIAPIIARAKSIKLNVREVDDKYLRAMDKASSGRPHNGFILEASPLPQPPITELGPSSLDGHFSVSLGRQSAEDAAVNGIQTEYNYKSSGWRHPLFLYLDGVLNEGNLGAIARSAYILGVDAIATSLRESAPWSHITLKASAGAAEAIPIFSVASPSDFLGNSARQGWRIYASDAVPAEETKPLLTSPPSTAVTPAPEAKVKAASGLVYTLARSTRRLPYDHSPVASHPTILMMGAEDVGLRSSLLNVAHYKVGIRHERDTNEVGVDSLNVSVAASLLCYEMMQKKVVEKKKGALLF